MKKEVIILGGSGMLGSMLADYLSRNNGLRVVATVRDPSILAVCAKAMPEVEWRILRADADTVWDDIGVLPIVPWIINAIGVTKPHIVPDNLFSVSRAIRINAAFPHTLAERVQRKGTQIIQIATDCVYDGHIGGYTEDAPHNPHDVYGKTKSLGEVHSDKFFNIRCSIVGPEAKAEHYLLLEWLLANADGATVNGYIDHVWNGITTLHFAKICEGIIKNDMELPNMRHVVPADTVSKYELLKLFVNVFNRNIDAIPVDAPTAVNGTLRTQDVFFNNTLWDAAGYQEPPCIAAMMGELAAFDYRVRGMI